MPRSPSAPATTSSLAALSLLIAGLAALALWVLWQPFNAGYAEYRRTIAQTLAIYWKDPTWQHGALAPLIAGWLVWRQKDDLIRLPTHPSVFGLFLLLLGGFFYFAGFKANNFYFGVAAIQLFLAGAVLWALGWDHSKRLAFAWLILCFSWPLIFLEETMAFHLRLIMVRATSGLLNTIGVPTLADGTALVSMAGATREMGELFRLNIDGPCSGMRSLFALMMVSALFSYFRQPTLLRRCLLFASSVPIAVLANLVRLLVLVAASAAFGQDFAVGDQEKQTSTFHFTSGLVVFIVALGGLQATSTLLNRLHRKRRTRP